jgi:hypothetical protein
MEVTPMVDQVQGPPMSPAVLLGDRCTVSHPMSGPPTFLPPAQTRHGGPGSQQVTAAAPGRCVCWANSKGTNAPPLLSNHLLHQTTTLGFVLPSHPALAQL